MTEPLVSSSPSLPPSGDPSPKVSSGAPQPTRLIGYWNSILLSVLPLATRSPLEEPFDINWQPRDAWSGFGNKEEFPPLTSEPSLLATALLAIARCLFDDTMASSDMDSSSPISSDKIYVSTGEH